MTLGQVKIFQLQHKMCNPYKKALIKWTSSEFRSQKETVKKMERQATAWDKIINQNSKGKISIKKMGQKMQLNHNEMSLYTHWNG